MEEWRRLNEYPGYEVSSLGRVRSCRAVSSTFIGRVLKQWVEDNGYCRVSLSVDGIVRKEWVQRLVAFAFIGPAPSPEHEAAHWNGIKTDNSAQNIRWATPAENSDDARRHGTIVTGERHHAAKLTDAQVSEIRSLYRGEWGEQTALAKRYGVSQPAINEIVRGVKRRKAS